jgi:hypothetical protein
MGGGMTTLAPPLPREARELLERERVPLADACRFLGMTRQAANPKARRYVKRTYLLTKSGKPFDVAKLRPQRNTAGDYTEIPVYKTAHGYMVRTDLLVPMVYPEAAFVGTGA